MFHRRCWACCFSQWVYFPCDAHLPYITQCGLAPPPPLPALPPPLGATMSPQSSLALLPLRAVVGQPMFVCVVARSFQVKELAEQTLGCLKAAGGVVRAACDAVRVDVRGGACCAAGGAGGARGFRGVGDRGGGGRRRHEKVPHGGSERRGVRRLGHLLLRSRSLPPGTPFPTLCVAPVRPPRAKVVQLGAAGFTQPECATWVSGTGLSALTLHATTDRGQVPPVEAPESRNGQLGMKVFIGTNPRDEQRVGYVNHMAVDVCVSCAHNIPVVEATLTPDRFRVLSAPTVAVLAPVGDTIPTQCVRVSFDESHPEYDRGATVAPSLQGYVFRLAVRRDGCTSGACDQRVYFSSGRHVPPQNYQEICYYLRTFDRYELTLTLSGLGETGELPDSPWLVTPQV